MQKEAIIALLEERHQELFAFLEQQDPDMWEAGPQGKWTTGQQALHLLQSIKTLNTALSIPQFLLKLKFGTSNRECRNYDAVVKRYKERLEQSKGVVFKPSQNMKLPNLNDKSYIINRLQTENKKLQYKTSKWTDDALNKRILPHPLMGKMPVRELVMWTAYHVQHHLNQLKENY